MKDFLKETKTGVGTAGISKEEYESIDIGMSIYKVHEIIDKEDKWNDNEVYCKSCEELSKENNNNLWTYVYKYYGEKDGYAIITYQADYTGGHYDTMTVVKKEQHNLK